MAEVAAGFLGPAIEVVKWVSAPILRQFNYLCCFTANITNLKNEAQKLQDTERDLQGKVDAARNDVRLISSEVETWLRNSKEIKDEKDGIIDEVPNVEGGCLKFRARFSLSRKAKKTTDRLKELRDQCKFNSDAISQPRPPAATEVVPSERTYNFDSRKSIEEEIMTTLRREDVNMMGIRGMGGLGKTTMAKRIMNRALEEHVFEEVVMAVVSQPIDKLKIQLEIGGSLGLKVEGETSQARVQKLHKRLSGTKRTLLVLDDVWETFKLEDLGIPHGFEGCTILLTSRSRDVLSGMNVQKIFGMEVLSVEDSWFLFKEKVGTRVDDTEFNSIAKEVVNECGRLPIALITVGSALKDKVHVSAWKNALRQLKRHDPDIPDFIKNVYYPLELSYDVLEHKYKLVFLLCCLYPEDVDIPLERLTYFCMGLRLFEGGMVEERDRMHSLIDVLKDRSLLLDSNKGDDYVRMHDVVRDVCIYIATKNKYISGGDSSLQRYEFDPGYALLQIHKSTDEEIKFDGIRDLYVLSIERCLLTSLPFTQMPYNLITLVLDSCRRLETLSVVGELVNLEILICRDCDSIEELPPEIKGLNRLKVLDLTRCVKLQRIGRGIISSLEGLEELKMLGSFKKWEAEDREGRENAGLGELEALNKLRCLELDFELVAKKILLSSKVDRFTIRVLCGSFIPSKPDKYLAKKKMSLTLEEATSFEHWKPFLRETECLILYGNGANKVCLPELEKIRYLELGECESLKNVVTSMDDGGGAIVFPSIEHLILCQLPKLEEICDRPVSLNCFQMLKKLKLNNLPVLKQLWKSSQNDLGKDFLPQLEVLKIYRCEMMEGVFLWKGEDGNENNSCHPITIMFPKLKKIELVNLPNLISLCQGIEGIEFPLMRKINIIGCDKMKGMVWNEKISGGSSYNASIHALFFPQEVLFGCLKKLDTDRNPFSVLEELEIFQCQGNLSLFTSSMAGNLVNLQRLEIRYCEEMVEVIKDEEEKGMSGGQSALLFPKLHTLHLWHLPKLVSFCESKGFESIQFPVLRSMKIVGCGKMKGMVANGLTSNENNSGGSNNHAHPNLFCESQLVSFGRVKKLEIDWNPFCSHTIHVSLFNGLDELTIHRCAGSLSLFTSSIAGNLLHLKQLSIEECHEMVQVIIDDEETCMSGGERASLFPKLHKISLSGLSKLVSFCELKCDVEFPSFSEVEINGCPDITLGSLAAPNLKSFNTDLKDDLLQVPFISPKQLSVFGNEKPLNCYQIHGSVFDRLEVLYILGYKGSMRLFSSSITRNLVNLTTLTIQLCDKMVKVIEEKEEEKEKVVSGAQRTTILFPKLQRLWLGYLSALVRFCEWKCDVELPSLRKVSIQNCDNMKNFTLGPLNTPKLESVEIGFEEFGGVKNLNGLVQQRYLSREEEEEKKKEKKKNGQEIMEEQN